MTRKHTDLHSSSLRGRTTEPSGPDLLIAVVFVCAVAVLALGSAALLVGRGMAARERLQWATVAEAPEAAEPVDALPGHDAAAPIVDGAWPRDGADPIGDKVAEVLAAREAGK